MINSMINYWARMNSGKASKHNVMIYNILLELFKSNLYKSKWVVHIKHILDSCGMSNLFDNPLIVNKAWLKLSLKRKLQDQFIQSWQENLNNHSIYINYSSYKQNLVLEPYFVEQPFKIRKIISKFKCNNHQLEVELGRHFGIVRPDRLCKKCNLNALGDEYHLVMECQNVEVDRSRKHYLPTYCHSKPSMFKYIDLMKNVSSNRDLCTQFGCFLLKVL